MKVASTSLGGHIVLFEITFSLPMLLLFLHLNLLNSGQNVFRIEPERGWGAADTPRIPSSYLPGD